MAAKGELLLSRRQILEVLPATIMEMRERLGAGKTSVYKRLDEMRAAKLVYRSGWQPSESGHGSPSAVFSEGDLPDVPGPGEPGFVYPRKQKTISALRKEAGTPQGSLGATMEFINEVRNRWPQGPFAALFNYNEAAQ